MPELTKEEKQYMLNDEISTLEIMIEENQNKIEDLEKAADLVDQHDNVYDHFGNGRAPLSIAWMNLTYEIKATKELNRKYYTEKKKKINELNHLLSEEEMPWNE